jgi:hypothetical protein
MGDFLRGFRQLDFDLFKHAEQRYSKPPAAPTEKCERRRSIPVDGGQGSVGRQLWRKRAILSCSATPGPRASYWLNDKIVFWLN